MPYIDETAAELSRDNADSEVDAKAMIERGVSIRYSKNLTQRRDCCAQGKEIYEIWLILANWQPVRTN